VTRLAVALLAAAALAGAAPAAPGDPEKREIRPADQAWAARATLRARDVPGDFSATRAPRNNAPLRCAGFQPDLSDLTITGEAVSPLFQSASGTSIYSGAEVYKSIHDERESWRRTARPAALRCLSRLLESVSTSGVRVKVTRRLVRAAPRVGERAISYRIAATFSAQGLAVRAWIDLLGVAHGRADATVVLSAVRAAPSPTLEGELLATLARRLKR
jgi:hypothetical protein